MDARPENPAFVLPARNTCAITSRGTPVPSEAPLNAPHHNLLCPVCARRTTDDGLLLECPADHERTLLRVEYAAKGFTPDLARTGLFRYRDWLPVRRELPGAGGTVMYRSIGLAEFLGLRNLWIAFNGYWPERGCTLETGTFKELEAYSVLARLPDDPPTLVVSSAGNTAVAFAVLASRCHVPCVIVVPAGGLGALMLREPPAPWVRLIALEQADYSDAIDFADSLSRALGGRLEGGTRNVARRAGLATVLLAAIEALPRMPDFYFQAVGSGAGAIGVHEAARRLVEAGLAETPPRLMLCQNAAMAPLYDAWRGTRTRQAHLTAPPQVFAPELTNRHPPYGTRGGVRDCLVESAGDMLVADRTAADAARALFADMEHIDIEPAAAVAVACLRQSVADGTVPRDATVLLNITGGGRRRIAEQALLSPAAPVSVVPAADWRSGEPPVGLLRNCAVLQ
ncbi:cysteate synthase [Streptomyces dioscori]|uniref:Cysteate synthase n=1 Tax=Streptomyces dioscori TaxID=2109333 RepID=A0A2P8PVJ9_9ACTN|nr:cysteate synthase [Streptomyces dioscori]